jgi:dihydroorotate dehydrogenase electron transfer subunit
MSQAATDSRILLVGGGIGTAPLLYTGKILKNSGFNPIFLLGGRTKNDIVQIEEFRKLGIVHITTEDCSAGEKGFVTNHSALASEKFDKIYACGPKPMMVAVAKYAKERDIDCEVSLENMMACGIGACLCCVEKTVRGNVCVCTEGPVFNINQLTWQI